MIYPGSVHSLNVPEHLQKHLVRIGGTNLYGEPIFRLVWSNDRLKWTGTPLYKGPRHDRFIIEVYRPPAFYGSRETWEMTTYNTAGLPNAGKGPYPSRGDWDYLDTCEAIDADGERNFLLPTEAYLDTVVNLYNLLLASPEKEVQDKTEAQDEAKRRNGFEYTLERIKERTDPLFRPAFAAFNNTAGLTRDPVQLAQKVEAFG